MKNRFDSGPTSFKRLALAVAALGAAGAMGALVTHQNQAGANAQPAPAILAPAAPALAPAAAGAIVTLPDFSQIAARNSPAVVNISVTGSTMAAHELSGPAQAERFGNDPFFEFFRRFQEPGRGARNIPTHGLGSGFIVSADGVIITNAHVVRDAQEVNVKLTDRREFRARVLGSDPKTDIAILKIEARNLPVLALGRSSELKVGEWVLAIGSPFGFDSTVTAGVVSAKGRSLPDDSNVPFIQTDVAVNPGNSGGPLFNARGEVVGVNAQIYSRTGGYQGLSFAIPIDVANRVREQIVATGKVSHARLGVSVQEVNQAFADSFGLAAPEGALVANVEPGSPAERAGLRPGDVIRKLNGQPIVASGDLPAAVGLARPGDPAALELWRDGKTVALTARLASAGEQPDVDAGSAPAGKLKLGLALRPLQPDERRAAGLGAGLLVQDADGAAANAGVERGDVLLSVNGKPVGSVEQVRELVARADKSVALLIQRGDQRIFIPVRLG